MAETEEEINDRSAEPRTALVHQDSLKAVATFETKQERPALGPESEEMTSAFKDLRLPLHCWQIRPCRESLNQLLLHRRGPAL